MTTSELIDELQKVDKDQEVYISFFSRCVRVIKVSSKLIPDGNGNFKQVIFIE